MDYEGLYKDLMMMRQRAHANGDWCRFGDRWRELAAFIDEIDQFTNDLFLRGYGY